LKTSSKVEKKAPVKKVETVIPDKDLDLEKSLIKAIDSKLEASNGVFWKQSNGFAPSNSNQCPRFAVYRFRGYQQQNNILGQTRRIFDLGNRVEDAVGALFEDLGILVDSQVELDITDPVPIRGFIDFIIDWDGEKPVECKSINEAGFAYRKAYHKPKDEHFRQLQFYLYGKGYDSGFLLYYSKNNSEILPLLVKRDDEFLEKTFSKYKRIYKVYEEGNLPERPYKKTSQKCEWCDAFDHCWSDNEVGVELNLRKKE
jgi:CRISPR/Cas system-associated exonuclease Cas4 (RecB family)